MRASNSLFLPTRGLRYHVRTWGDPSSPKLFLLHGWMDVAASFQFLVDELEKDWYVLAPDWRGYGLTEWPQDGYWFADYVGDLDALLQALSPSEPVNLVGHSLGGNVAGMYAGLRPERVRRLISLEGFGVPTGQFADAPDKFAKWLDSLAKPPELRPFADLAAAADRLQKTNPRLRRDRAEFLAEHWTSVGSDGVRRLQADPKHRMPFPTVSHSEEWMATWRRMTAPVLWVVADQSETVDWATGGSDAEWERRVAAVPGLRVAHVAGAGHMMQHDQPGAVAKIIEQFVR